MEKFLKWVPSLVIMLIIFSLSSVPGETVNSTVARNDNVQMAGHFLLFTLLCLSYFRATRSIKISLILTFFYACFDEIRQSFTPDRSTSIKDIVVDMIGASIAVFILWKKLPNQLEKLKNLLLK
jgi:VanZ family protein